jgi:hypothetical protein
MLESIEDFGIIILGMPAALLFPLRMLINI